MDDPTGAVLVRVAAATGRSVLEVAHESFALTLYTLFHLKQLAHVDAIERRLDRFDLAGLMANAYHGPKDLADAYDRYVATFRPAVDRDASIARALVHVAAHRRMTPFTPQAG